jgi:hypothetical protein
LQSPQHKLLRPQLLVLLQPPLLLPPLLLCHQQMHLLVHLLSRGSLHPQMVLLWARVRYLRSTRQPQQQATHRQQPCQVPLLQTTQALQQAQLLLPLMQLLGLLLLLPVRLCLAPKLPAVVLSMTVLQWCVGQSQGSTAAASPRFFCRRRRSRVPSLQL